MQHLQQSLAVKDCPNCGRGDVRPFLSHWHKGQLIHYSSCGHCGLVFQNPTATAEEWDDFYQHKYRLIYNGQEGPTVEETTLQQQRAEIYVGFLEASLHRPPASHLDIGCAMGILAQAVKGRWQISRSVGVEPGQAYRDYCSANGIECYASVAALPEGEKFDLITLAHVLEHVNRPAEFLRHLVETRLAADGFLFLEVPNIRGGLAMEMAHPICFSPKTLRDTLALAGLEEVATHLHGRPKTMLQTDHRYIAVIARKTRAAKAPTDIQAAGFFYKVTGRLALWRGMTRESWLIFALKYPVRLLKHGFFPKAGS